MTQEAFGYKFHWAVADYLQRSARHMASKVDVEQAYAVGKAAVQFALQGQERRDARSSCASPPRLIVGASARRRCRRIANEEKKVPRNFITPDGFGITAACRRYLLPLIGGRGLPAISSRPTGVRDAQGRAASRSASARPFVV